MKHRIIAILCCLLPALGALAQDKMQADEAYRQQEYEEAVDMYQQLLSQEGAEADVFYNLGNAYFRLDSLPQAILAYERALLLLPNDADTRHNLQVARSKTVDKIVPEREMFFVTWYHSLVSLISVDVWAWLALAALCLAVVLALVYFFAEAEGLRKVGFYASVALLAVFLLGNLFAWQQKRLLTSHDGAIVMSSSLTVKNIPADNGTDEFSLHAGTKVQITDDTLDDWLQISLPDGRQGWIHAGNVEVI